MNAPQFKPGDRVKVQIRRIWSPRHLNGRSGTVVRQSNSSIWKTTYLVVLDSERQIQVYEGDLVPDR